MAVKDKLVSLEVLKETAMAEIGELNSAVSGLFVNDPLDISAIEPTKGYVGSNMKWNSSNGYGDSITVTQSMKKLTVTAGENPSVVTFLASDTLVNGATVTVTSTLGREIVASGETQAFDIPNDCVMIRLQTKSSTGVDNTPASMVFKKQIMQAADNTAVQTSLADINSKLPMPELVLPYAFRWCAGKQLNIYYQNCVKNFDIRKAMYARISALPSYDLFSQWTPASAKSDSGASFSIAPYNLTNAISTTIHYQAVAADAGSGLTKNLLLIGDSLTANQPLSKHLVDDLFAEDDMSIRLVGTLGTAPYKREGRSGWSPTDYVHKASVTSGNTTVTNPFFNPTSETFDFSYYMTNNKADMGFDSASDDVDYVFINLGTNISSADMDVTVDDMIADMEIMVQSILAYATAQERTIRVGVWTPPPRALVRRLNLPDHNNTMTRVQAIINAFDRRNASNIYIVPAGYNVDPYHDFNTQEVDISARNSNYKMEVLVDGDYTHPADAGYFKMADVIYCTIKYFGSLDAV